VTSPAVPQKRHLVRRSPALALGLAMIVASISSAVVIYLTHPSDPHDEGFVVGLAAALWPFLLWPLAWLACAVLVLVDWRTPARQRALAGLLLATAAWPVVFLGYYFNRKPWLSPREKLLDHWPDVRARGATLLGERAELDDLPALITSLSDPEIQVRSAAATALARYGPRAAPAIPALTATLQDHDWMVSCMAADALGSMRGLQAKVVPPLVAQLSRGGDFNPWCAAGGLALLGPDAAAAVPDLTRLLQHQDPGVRSQAAEALGRIGPLAKAAIPDLKGLLQDPNEWARKSAEAALPRVAR
jgi:hypothetical protein